MSKEPKSIKELIDGLTDEEILRLKDARTKAGATSCKEINDDDHKYLVTQYPPEP